MSHGGAGPGSLWSPSRARQWVGNVAAAFADPPVLYVVFRSDHTFSAYLADGTPVGTSSGAPTVISAGAYKLILDDTSETDMDFDLAGPGVKLMTNMSHAEEGSAAYVETFQPSSTYTFRDDQHPGVAWTFQDLLRRRCRRRERRRQRARAARSRRRRPGRPTSSAHRSSRIAARSPGR